MPDEEVVEKNTKIKVGDTVIVTGFGVKTNLGGGEVAPYYDRQFMKVISIKEDTYFKYGLNRYNKGTNGDETFVTAWFDESKVKKA